MQGGIVISLLLLQVSALKLNKMQMVKERPLNQPALANKNSVESVETDAQAHTDAQAGESVDKNSVDSVETEVDVRSKAIDYMDSSFCTPNYVNKQARNAKFDLSNSPCRSLLSVDDMELFKNGLEDAEDMGEWIPLATNENAAARENCTHSRLPTLLYLGLNHAGSTTIAKLLNMLPGWSWGKMKEHRFFSGPARSYVSINNRMRHKSFEAYKSEFKVGCSVKQTFDASPFYWALGNNEIAHKAVFRTEPGDHAVNEVKKTLGKDTKFIFTIKDPVGWLNSMDAGSPGKFVGNPEAERLMCMADSIEGWLKVFPRKNFLFLDSSKMFKDLPGTINQIVSFAGQPLPAEGQVPTEVSSGRRRNNRKLPDEYIHKFHTQYHSCKQRLEKLTGLKFSWGNNATAN